jgi:adenine-specific DNA-methyltransferase
LLHELLSEAGSIWITLDDNEVHRARMMLDAIFGEQNFVAIAVWQKRFSPDNDETYLTAIHDYVICYAKSKSRLSFNRFDRTQEADDRYENPDNDPRGPWTSSDLTRREYREHDFYPISLPGGREVYPAAGRSWSIPKATFEALVKDNRIWFGPDGNAMPRRKRFLAEVSTGIVPTSWWSSVLFGNNQDGKKEIVQIFSEESNIFQTPKPTMLIERILSLVTQPQAIILDSFAGSGTTAHAVLAANKKDSGDRKFILVEFEEYADNLTAERVRRVIGGYRFKGTQREELMRKSLTFTDLKKSTKLLHDIAGLENIYGHQFDNIDKKVKDGELIVEGVKAVTERVEGLGGSFTYCTLGEAIEMDRMLTGECLPSFQQLGALLFHMATNEAIDPAKVHEMADGHGYLGESASFHVWLIYKPELDFLKSRDSALTLTKSKEFAAQKPGKRHLVFAPAKFVSQKVLDEEKVPVEFAPLPWALYRIERS